MIDTHCHLLPGLDDGPRTMSESVALARALSDSGVTAVACTPHFSSRYPTPVAEARRGLASLPTALAAESVELDIALAAEVSPAFALDAADDELVDRTMGGEHLLVEIGPGTPGGVVELVVERLGGLGLLPILAHPERCRAVRERPQVLDGARASGALVQVVARSLADEAADGVADAAWEILDAGRADLIATDAHRPGHAGAALVAALVEVGRRYGAASLEALTDSTPAGLIGGSGGRR